jgi:hypothetical protein
MRILRLVARHRQRELSDHDAGRNDHPTPESRRHLQQAATKSGVQVAQAERRRRQGREELPAQVRSPLI